MSMDSLLKKELSMSEPVRTADRSEVSVLDLTPLTHAGAIDVLAGQLDQACRETGFFYVSNHGVSENALSAVFEATRRYFALPAEVRQGHLMHPYFRRGFMPQGYSQQPGYEADLKESYEVGMDLPLDDPDVVARRPLHAPNQWPAELPWLRAAAETYFNQTKALGERLLRLIARALDLEEGYFLRYIRKPLVQMRLFHYAPQPVSEAALGAAPHTDFGMFTLLAQDPIGGLELKKRDGEWIAAPYIDGTLVVNIGDLFQRWTNGRYVSNFHRVTNRTGRERYSIPMFFNLDYDAPVVCLPTCCGEDNPPRYEPTTFGDCIVGRFKAVQKFRTDEAATA
jgi:isopenicillin N synthase-like dioxygenase